MIHAAMLLYAPHRLAVALRVMRLLARQPQVAEVLFVVNGSALAAADVLARFGRVPVPVQTVEHDNRGAEFGAYQRAIDHFRDAGAAKTLLLNDTVGVHQFVDGPSLCGLLRRFDADASGHAAIGRVVQASDELAIGPWRTRHWLRSNLMGFDRGALETISHRLYAPELDAFVRDTTVQADIFGPEIGPYLHAHLSHWLFGSGAGTWYNAQPLTAASAPLLAGRARAIVQEMALSMRLRAGGAQFIDHDPTHRPDRATWLREKLWNKTRWLWL